MASIPLIWEYVAIQIDNISRISTYDFITVTATYYSLLNGIKDSENAVRNRGYSLETLDKIRKTKIDQRIEINGLVFSKPLSSFYNSSIGYLLLLLENYEKGNLPFEGCISDQPAQIIDLISILRNIQTEHKIKIEKQTLESMKRKK